MKEDLIWDSSSGNGIPSALIAEPARNRFRFLSVEVKSFGWIVIAPLFIAFWCVFRVLSSRAIRMSIFESWDSIGVSEMQSVLKLWPPRIRDS